MDRLNKIGIGSIGFVSTEVAPAIQQVAEMPISELMKAVTQIAIAVATILSLFVKRKAAK